MILHSGELFVTIIFMQVSCSSKSRKASISRRNSLIKNIIRFKKSLEWILRTNICIMEHYKICILHFSLPLLLCHFHFTIHYKEKALFPTRFTPSFVQTSLSSDIYSRVHKNESKLHYGTEVNK